MKKVPVSSLRGGDVVRSRQFVGGWSARADDPLTRVGAVAAERGDPSRETALYVVEKTERFTIRGDCWHPDQPVFEVYARRLKSDESYDPDGEKIVFCDTENVREVTLVARMIRRGKKRQIDYLD